MAIAIKQFFLLQIRPQDEEDADLAKPCNSKTSRFLDFSQQNLRPALKSIVSPYGSIIEYGDAHYGSLNSIQDFRLHSPHVTPKAIL